MFKKNFWLFLSACLLAMFSMVTHAQPLLLNDLPAGSLGAWADLHIEESRALSLDEAQALLRQGKFQRSNQSILSDGIGSKPLWLHVELLNPTAEPLPLKLVVGTTWADRISVYLVHDNQAVASWKTGDEIPNAPGLTQGIGFTLSPSFAPGRSDLFLRVESIDPLVFPIELLTEEKAVSQQQMVHYSYGFIFGFLTALATYNMILFVGLRKRSYFYYALYLASLIVLIICYTGHGSAWLWPDQPQIQRYVILIMMVIYGCSGLLFACRFLSLKDHAPRILRLVQCYAALGLLSIAFSIMLGSQLTAARAAFTFAIIFSLCMVFLSILTMRAGQASGRYFFTAAFFGMIGSAVTTLAVWGWIPFNTLTYHALEYGVVIEATLFALALSYHFNKISENLTKINELNNALSLEIAERKNIEQKVRQLAFYDTLTKLPNRRLFNDRLSQAVSASKRSKAYGALMFLDLDNFKPLNDRYGHDVGDLLLIEAAHRLENCVREMDTVARFGGDEFVVILAELDEDKAVSISQAVIVAEKIRATLSEPYKFTAHAVQPHTSVDHHCTGSIGVVVFNGSEGSQDDIIKWADLAMYEAKNAGRNKIRFYDANA